MKQKLFLFFTICSIHGIFHAQKQGNFKNDSVKQYIDKTLLLIHNNAFNKDKIDWNSLKTEVYNKTKNAENIQALKMFLSPVSIVKKGNVYIIDGTETLKLSEFGMERPGFMGIKTGDVVNIKVNVVAE